MKFCLSCHHLASGSARYCPYCRRSLGARLCKKGHPSPTGARCCVECGSPELSDPALSVGFGWISQLLAGLCVLLLLKWADAHLRCLLCLAARCLAWTVGFVLNLPLGGVDRLLGAALPWLLVLTLLSPMLPKTIRGFHGKWIPRVIRHLWRGLCLFLKLLAALVKPSRTPKTVKSA